MNMKIEKAAAALRKNNMAAFYTPSKAAALKKVEELLDKNALVAVGGSVSLAECGVLDLLRSGKYRFLDRHAPNLTPEEIQNIFIASFSADAYLCSANAVTENGELYNVDGNANRVAAICYGPKKVILVVGVNKIVKDIGEAVKRVKTVAAPKNALRLNADTPCKFTGQCVSEDMTGGCATPNRMCSSFLISSYQKIKDRIAVILVDENLGY